MEHPSIGINSALQLRTVHGVPPGPESQRPRQPLPHILFHLHAHHPPHQNRRNMARRSGIRIALARRAPQRLLQRELIRRRPRPIVNRGILPGLLNPLHIHWIRPANPRRHRQHLPQRNLRFPRIVQRENFRRHKLRRENLLVQSIGKQRRFILHHHPHRHARERLPARRQLR